MRAMRWAAVSLLGAMAVTGCTKKVEPPAGPVIPPPGMSQEIRERIQQLHPDVLFGSVAAVHPEDQLVAVSGIPADQCKPADPIMFYAGDQIINKGRIERIVNGALHIRYETPTVGERAPEVGDVAVKIKPAAN
ncbi:MAG: hypothetical protein ABSH20_12175 [Tepidisphaeraceae bacterium]|jgi:hypothetical protein